MKGEQQEQGDNLKSLGKNFILAMIVVYMLLAIPFKSYFQPLVVMSSIPFGVTGAVIGHIVMGMNLSVLSMMGIVALTGVVVNDSLVMVDFINRYRKDGNTIKQAVLEAGPRRFRPIFLTSLTTFVGLVPLILEKSTQAKFIIPMAVSLILRRIICNSDHFAFGSCFLFNFRKIYIKNRGGKMRVALIGGTGFVGSYLIDELIKNNHTPRLLVRSGSDHKVVQQDKCEIIHGDIENDNALKETLEGCDAVIYLIALIREFPKKGLTNERLQFKGSEKVAKLAEELGVKRFLLMSALGANPDPKGSKYMQAKHLSEQAIKNTNLQWTIFRPSSLLVTLEEQIGQNFV